MVIRFSTSPCDMVTLMTIGNFGKLLEHVEHSRTLRNFGNLQRMLGTSGTYSLSQRMIGNLRNIWELTHTECMPTLFIFLYLKSATRLHIQYCMECNIYILILTRFASALLPCLKSHGFIIRSGKFSLVYNTSHSHLLGIQVQSVQFANNSEHLGTSG